MIGKPQDYITPLEDPCDSTRRLVAELETFDVLLMSIKQLPHPDPEDPYGLVMSFHTFTKPPDLHTYVGPIPTSATFVLKLNLESYKSWYILPAEERRVPGSRLRLHVLKFAQDFHRSIVRFRLSEPLEPEPACECSKATCPCS